MRDVATAGTIGEATRVLWLPDSVYELRVLNTARHTISGYFDDAERFVQAAASWDGKAPAVYVTLNPVKPALLARANNRCHEAGTGSTTADHDIDRRTWLPIDFDAIRPAGISASDEEHQGALDRAEACWTWLLERGCPSDAIVYADSGNGGHVLVRVDLPNDDAARDLMQRCLQAIALRFDDEAVAVDLHNYNAARIWKVYGTLVRKGEDMPERPHRRAALLSAPGTPIPAPRSFLEELASAFPKPAPLAKHGTAFDIDAWMRRHLWHALAYEAPWNGGHKYVLQVCPFNSDHDDKSAVVLQHQSGAVSFTCHHNGCTGRSWSELRALYEPRPVHPPSRPKPEPDRSPGIPARMVSVDQAPNEKDAEYGLAELMARDLPPLHWAVDGVIPEGLTLVIGKAKLGKSLLVLGLCIAVASGGVALGRIAVPPSGVLYLALEDGWRRIQKRSSRILGDALGTNDLRLRLRWPRLDKGGLDALEAWLDTHTGTRLIAIDTLQRVRALQSGRSPFAEDYAALEGLQDLAERRHVCIVVVHHARKGEADDPLDTINGTMGLTASADGLLILQRRRTENDATLHVTQRDGDEGDQDLALTFDSGTGTWHLEGDTEEYRVKKWEEETIAILRDSAEPLRSSELAELMDIPQGTIKVRLHRLMKEGKVRLVSRGAYTATPEPAEALAYPRYNPAPDHDDDMAF